MIAGTVCTAEDESAVIDHGDVGAADLLAEATGEEAGVAVDGVSVGGLKDVADDAAGDLRREDDGCLLGLDALCTQAAQRSPRGLLADVTGSSSRRVVREAEYQ